MGWIRVLIARAETVIDGGIVRMMLAATRVNEIIQMRYRLTVQIDWARSIFGAMLI